MRGRRLLDVLGTDPLVFRRAGVNRTDLITADIRLGTGASFGVTPSTAAITVPGTAGHIEANDGLWDAIVWINHPARLVLADLAGEPEPSEIPLHRLIYGRIDSATVIDAHRDYDTRTTFDLADELSLLNLVGDEDITITLDLVGALSVIFMHDYISSSVGAAGPQLDLKPGTAKASAIIDMVAASAAQLTTAKDAQYGGAQLVTHARRVWLSEQWHNLDIKPRLARKHVLSPIEWTQQNAMGVRLVQTYTDSNGDPAVQNISVGASGRPRRLIESDVQLAHHTMQSVLAAAGYAIARTEAAHQPIVRQVTIPVRTLLESKHAPDRRAAARLALYTYPNTILGLGLDWPANVRGVYFVTSVQHQITADDWRVTLTLAPHVQVVGTAADYDPQPATWEDLGEMAWEDLDAAWNALEA